jgi:transposase
MLEVLQMFHLRELKQKGLSIRAIATATGYNFRTVKKYLEADQQPRYRQRAPRKTKVGPFKEYILRRMSEGLLNATVLLDEIRTMGYTGGPTQLRDFVHTHRPPKPNQKAVMRYKTAPGEQAQVDFGVFKYIDQAGQEQRVYVFCLILSYSRVHYIEFIEHQDLDTFLRCHLNAFEAIGGVPKTILYDNAKVVVLGREDGQPQWQPRFADFASLVGFVPKLCRPYRAQTKGRVERLVRYIRENFWPGRKFTDLADLNQQGRVWCEKTNRRVHGTTKNVPQAALQGELPQLLAIPDRMRVEHLLGEVRTVSRDGFVSWDGSRYGVPWQFSGCKAVIKERNQFIEVWDSLCRTRLALHVRAAVRGSTVILPGQYDGIPLGGEAGERVELARQVDAPAVQVRSLATYEALVGGAAQ